MPLRLIADAGAQTTIPLALTSGATSFVGASTANFTQPQNFGNGVGRLTLLDAGNPAWNPAAPLVTPFEYCDYTNNNTGTNTISGLTRGVAGTTAHNFFAGAIVAQGLLVEDILASSTWKFDEQNPTSGTSITIPSSGSFPASYLGIAWRHIDIEYTINGGASGGVLQMQYNADVAAHYEFNQVLLSGGAWTFGGIQTGQTSMRVGVANTTGTIANKGYIEIPDYVEAVWRKLLTYRCIRNDAGAEGLEIGMGVWTLSPAAAITTITLFLSAGAYASGCKFVTRVKP